MTDPENHKPGVQDPESPLAAPSDRARMERIMGGLCLLLGFFALDAVLGFFNIADSDLWARLAAGAGVWKHGRVFPSDPFAFTPTLPEWIDHEWGAGVIFYGLIRSFGPGSLMLFRTAAAVAALAMALLLARRGGARREAVLLLALPCAIAVVPGYVAVVRSHALTYLFFAFTLLALDLIRNGHRWPAFVLVPLMAVWANCHGGFVSGLGATGVFACEALLRRRHRVILLSTLAAMLAATLLNPWGARYWVYLIPALLHDRPEIVEWQPLPLLRMDSFIGFRISFVLVVIAALMAARELRARLSPAEAVMLALTAYLGWSSRRHAPFFGIAALAFAPPLVESALLGLRSRLPAGATRAFRPIHGVVILYALAFLAARERFGGESGSRVLAPVGFYPVRETDLLMYSGARGTLAVPFRWGSYALWRLYPRILVSIDGRYEETYPESTFLLNQDFFNMRGPEWDRLVREHRPDYVMLELRYSPLRPEHLADAGYETVYSDEEAGSVLLARGELAPALREFAKAQLPPETIEPLDASITDSWWKPE